jgi:hypothetical protein
MKLIYALLIFLLPGIISAQSIQLRGKVIDINNQPVKNLSIRFTSFGDAVTTGSGEFVITIPQNVRTVDVVIKDEILQLLYPVDAKVPVPVDPNFVTTIIVSGKNTSMGRSVDESILKYNELESLLRNVGTTNTELKIFLEKFIQLEAKRLEISEAKLTEEFERKDRRDSIFSEISTVLKEYILRVNNLKTYFEMYYESAFVSNPSVEQLNSTIRTYNPSFDTIYNNQNKWQNEINSAWDAVISENFASAVNYMIDEIHTPYILQLNECVKSINDVRLKIENDGKSTAELKSDVRTKVTAIMKSLGLKIPILENRFNELITRMQHSGIN